MTRAERPVRLRPAAEEDARPLAELWAAAFPGEPRVDVRLRALLEGTGPYGGIEHCWVAESEGQLLGGLRQFSFRMQLWGSSFPAQGLASVAVFPEHRRRGVGQWMCGEALRLGRARGEALSALFPFRADFYARLGFLLVGELHRYRFAASELPEYPEHERVQPILGEARRPLLSDFYRDFLPRTQGLIERTEAMWRDRLDGAELVYGAFDEAGALRGYLIASPARARAPDRSTLRVQELLAADEAAYRALLGWLALQRDQWPNLRYDALPGEQLHQRLRHPRRPGSPSARGLWFPSAFLLRGPMLRILDLPALLEGAGVRPSTVPRVRDPLLPENDLGGGSGEPTTIRALTERLFMGTLPGQEEKLAGWSPAMGLRDFRLLDIF